jgi:hypothetical protein
MIVFWSSQYERRRPSSRSTPGILRKPRSSGFGFNNLGNIPLLGLLQNAPLRITSAIHRIIGLFNFELQRVGSFLPQPERGVCVHVQVSIKGMSELVSEVPVMRVNEEMQKPFITLVDQILAAKQGDAVADTKALAQVRHGGQGFDYFCARRGAKFFVFCPPL